MSVISIGTTLTTGLILESDTSGELIIKTGPSATTALTIDASQNVAFAKAPVFPSATVLNGVTYTWPSTGGASGEFLTSNGAGILYWSEAAGLPTINVSSSTNISAVAGNHYVLTAASLTTVTLPASPTIGDAVWVTTANGLTTNVVARNGKKINEVAEDMTINTAYAGIQFRFSGDTKGWVFS